MRDHKRQKEEELEPRVLTVRAPEDEWSTKNEPFVSALGLRAGTCKYQTSPDSSKNSTSSLFHEKNPYIELFSKM